MNFYPSADEFVVRRSRRTYGIGTNPQGGAKISIQGYLARDRASIHQRVTVHRERVPVDGGISPEWTKFEALLGKCPWDATDDEIVRAWIGGLPAWAARKRLVRQDLA